MKIILENVIGNKEVYLQIMKTICGNTEGRSMVDLGAYHAPYTPLLGFKMRTYVDILDRKLDHKEEQEFFIKSDVINFLQRGNAYDVAIATDLLEHLTLRNGKTFLRLMQSTSIKQIIFTPLGDYLVEPGSKHPDTHKSGWTDRDFEEMGWKTITLPSFHPTLNIGAFFAFSCPNIEHEFERIKNELKSII